MSTTKEEVRKAVLEALHAEPRSPRFLEENPPESLPARDVRIAAQALLDEGVVVLNERLLLQPAQPVCG